MKVVKVEPLVLRIPFTDGSSGKGLFPSIWNNLEIVLVKISADNGLTGWGEGFGYFCSTAVASVVAESLAPMLVGREVSNIRDISSELQRRSVLSGRYGISTFALSGVDIALWDLKAKSESVPVYKLFSTRVRDSVTAYSSLVRYGNPELAIKYAHQSLNEGFREIKLHEIEMPVIRKCRQAIGAEVPLTIDVNCNWTETQTRESIPELKNMNIRWLEEPVFPPEDFGLLSELRNLGLPLAAGENACTSVQFSEMIRTNAVDYLQPSITKVGGISEYMKIIEMNNNYHHIIAPHSPYFGPGYLATLHMAAIDNYFSIFEFLYVKPERLLYPDSILPQKGEIQIPGGAGLGFDPDPEIIARYLVNK